MRFTITFLLLLVITVSAHAQTDSTRQPITFRSSVSVTNNGFSFIPSFTLGKPAAIVDLSVGGKRFSFDPQFRFNLQDAEPWSFIFIWRYKFINKEKFQVSVGTHLPALAFRTIEYTSNGTLTQNTISQRFLPFELTPNYAVSKNFSVGAYYLWARGLESSNQTRMTHFISMRANFYSIPLTKKIYARFFPQVYYLKTDSQDGYFVGSTLTVGLREFPLSIGTVINKAIETNIVVKDFDWNVSLIYSFNTTLTRR